MASVAGAQRGHAFHQLGIAAREAHGIEPDVVLQPGPAMSSQLEAPAVDLELVPPEAGGPPGRIRLERSELRDEELQQDRKSTRLNSSHYCASRLPSSA